MLHCFRASKAYEIHVNASITAIVLGGISFHVMAENWQHLKDTLSFSPFLMCKNRNIVMLTSDLLPNISLVVGQLSVNISLVLHALDISTLQLASDQ